MSAKETLVNSSPDTGHKSVRREYEGKILLLNRLEVETGKSDLLRHPFFDLFRSGNITVEQLKEFTGQQYHFSTSFPRCIAALYAVIPNYQASRPLIDHFLLTEGWGTTRPEAHSTLFRPWLKHLNLKEKDISKKIYPETERFLDTRMKLCSDPNYFQGLGALAYGHELINTHIFEIYTQGLKKIGTPENALSYFTAHNRDEVADYKVFKNIILQTAKTTKDIDSVGQGAKSTLDARKLFLDGLYPRLIR